MGFFKTACDNTVKNYDLQIANYYEWIKQHEKI